MIEDSKLFRQNTTTPIERLEDNDIAKRIEALEKYAADRADWSLVRTLRYWRLAIPLAYVGVLAFALGAPLTIHRIVSGEPSKTPFIAGTLGVLATVASRLPLRRAALHHWERFARYQSVAYKAGDLRIELKQHASSGDAAVRLGQLRDEFLKAHLAPY